MIKFTVNPLPFSIKKGLFPIIAIMLFVIGYTTLLSNYVEPVFDKGNDWTRYHKNAVDIIENGIWMPSFDAPYTAPAGFLYNYFLAAIYSVTNYSNLVVIQIQYLLLCLSVLFFYYAFRRKNDRYWNGFTFLALAHFAYHDFFYYSTGMILSENLVICLVALFFLLFRYGYENKKILLRSSAFFCLGLIYLTRPNYLPFLVTFAVWHGYQSFYKKKIPWKHALIDLLILFATVNLMGLRNFVVSGHWVIVPPIPWSAAAAKHWPYPGYIFDEPLTLAKRLFDRSLVVFGYTDQFVQWIGFRFHWALMWIGITVGMILRFRKQIYLSPIEQVLLLHLITVIGPIVAVACMTRYGIIFLSPGMIPGVGLFVFLFRQPESLENKSKWL